MAQKHQSGMSQDTKTIITVLLLVVVFPLGIIFMWVWMKWPIWVKLILTIPFAIIPTIAVLLAITLVAINPSKQFTQANNTMRSSNVNMILNAVNQYSAENNGQLPTGITAEVQNISTAGTDICKTLVPAYIAFLPVDPSKNKGKAITDCTEVYDTGYTIFQDAGSHKITVSAPLAGKDENIEVTR
jgi:hypothetical protein